MKADPSLQRTRVKICGLTREQDVDAAVQAGADAVGFVLFSKSPRFVTAARAAELARRLPPFVTPVLLFVNESPANVRAACEQVPGATLQFHGDETPQECLDASFGARPYLRAARIPLDSAVPFDLVRFISDFSHAQAILLDAEVQGYGGGGKAFDWSRIPTAEVLANARTAGVLPHLVLSGGLTASNVIDGIVQVRPRCRTLAVDVSSGVEVSKGIKDAEKINRFVAAVRAADRQLAESIDVSLSTT